MLLAACLALAARRGAGRGRSAGGQPGRADRHLGRGRQPLAARGLRGLAAAGQLPHRAGRRPGAGRKRPCCGSTTPRPPRSGQSKVIAYLEGNVVLEFHRRGAPARLTDRTWLGRFFTTRSVEVQRGGRWPAGPTCCRRSTSGHGAAQSGLRRRLRQTGVEPAQFTTRRASRRTDP